MSASVPDRQDDDPVSQALRMRASDADRERVAGVLRDAFAEGRLSPVEHEERLAEVYRATTYGELVPVLHDLPVPPGTLAVPMGPGAGVVAVTSGTGSASGEGGALVIAPDLAGSAETNAVAIFGGFERKDRWVVAPKMTSVCIFGGGRLDLTQAVLTSQETEISAVCVFGGLDIVVPEGVVVRLEAAAVFGGNDAPTGEPPPPGAPIVRITGAAIFGGISVRRPKPKKEWRKRLTG